VDIFLVCCRKRAHFIRLAAHSYNLLNRHHVNATYVISKIE